MIHLHIMRPSQRQDRQCISQHVVPVRASPGRVPNAIAIVKTRNNTTDYYNWLGGLRATRVGGLRELQLKAPSRYFSGTVAGVKDSAYVFAELANAVNTTRATVHDASLTELDARILGLFFLCVNTKQTFFTQIYN